ncbi:hypothetical protein [Flavobacterium beibuense]|uniref:hypothetical protein n=1 Tax=Flavobacterium beibuense TaxID=657326 RepID=UPI003A9266F5
MRSHIYGNIGFADFNTGGAIISFKNSAGTEDTKVTSVKVETKDKVSGVIASWGPNNDYPQQIIAETKKNGTAIRSLSFNRRIHYGNGIVFLKLDATEEGKHDPKVIPINNPDMADVKAFFKKSQMARFFKETIADLEWWSIAFPEYILSNDFSQINKVKRHKTAWCRFEVMNEESGLIENVYISEKFGKEGVTPDSVYVSKVPLIDSYWSVEEVKEYCKENKIHNFIRPIFYPLIDEAYYPVSEWHAAFTSGWLGIANAVPKWVKSMFENQASIKYHIEIDERYYEVTFLNEWKQFTKARRDEERRKTLDSINEHLSGAENAGKSIQTMMYVNQDGVQESYIKITTIDDKFKEGAYLPQAEAANSEVAFASGVDSSVIGSGIPGGKLGAGSGSDKNAAYNIANALMKTNRETTLETFDFIRDYNEWDDNISAAFENTVLTTLDKNPTGSQKIAN